MCRDIRTKPLHMPPRTHTHINSPIHTLTFKYTYLANHTKPIDQSCKCVRRSKVRKQHVHVHTYTHTHRPNTLR